LLDSLLQEISDVVRDILQNSQWAGKSNVRQEILNFSKSFKVIVIK